MAALKAFESNYADLVTIVSQSIKYVADECRSALIIGPDTYEKVIQSSKIPKDKARDLLQEISSRIEVQTNIEPKKCAFTMFVQILKKEPSLESIALKLEETLADIELRSSPNINAVDSGVVRDQSVSVLSREDSISISVDESMPLSESDASLNAPTAESSQGDRSQAPVFYVGGISSGVTDLRAQISDLKATDAEKEATIKELEDKLEKTIHDKNKTEIELKEAKKELDLLSKKKDEKIAKLERHITALKEMAASKEKENTIMKEKHQAEVIALRTTITENKELYDERMLMLTKEKCALEIKVKNFEIEEEKLKTEIEITKRKKAEAQCETAEVRQKLAEQKAEAESKEKDGTIALLRKQLEEMTTS